MVNPFDYEQDELIHITSGVVKTQNAQTGLQSANARRELVFTKFCEQHLQTGTVDFFATMKKLNLKTFPSMSKIFRHNVHGKDITLKADRNLLARLIVMGRYRKINLQKLLSYLWVSCHCHLQILKDPWLRPTRLNWSMHLKVYLENPCSRLQS